MKKILYNNIERFKANSNIRNGFLFTFFSFLNNGVNFLLLLILARYLAPDGYGNINLFSTLITILAIFIPLGTNGFIGNCYFRKEESDFKRVIGIVSSIALLMLFLITIILFFVSSKLNDILGLSFEYQIIALLICFFQLFNTINLEIWRLKEQPTKYGIYSLAFISFNFVLTLLFVISFHMDWEGRVYAQLIASSIFFVISLLFLIHRNLLTFQKYHLSLIKETLSFGLPLIPHLSAGWIRQGMDRYIMNFFCGTFSVGLFSFAMNFGNIIHMIGIAFNASNSVFLYKNLSNETHLTRSRLLKQTGQMCLFFLSITIIVYLSVYIAIPFMFPQYKDALPFLFPLCFSAFFQCVYYLFVNYLFYYRKTKKLMYITLFISLIHLLMSFLFTKYSTLYTAYINLFSSFLICILVIYYSQRIYSLLKREYE